MTRPKKDSFVDHLEKQIRDALRDPDIKLADRIKLIEAGSRLATTRQKLQEEKGAAGSFFER